MTDLPAILDALEAEKLARTDYTETQNGYRLTIGFAPGEVVLIHHDPDEPMPEPVSLDGPDVIVLNVAQARTLARELDRVADLAEGAQTAHPEHTWPPLRSIRGGKANR